MSTSRTDVTSAGGTMISLFRQIGHFALHFVEMCVPMCIGFALGDLVYFSIASLAGYTEPFTELPVLSVLLVTVFMTAPMTAWMGYRGMPRRAIMEMSAAMPIVAIVLLSLGWLGALPMDSLALLEHGLMMPAMLVPMLARLDLYAGRSTYRQGRDALYGPDFVSSSAGAVRDSDGGDPAAADQHASGGHRSARSSRETSAAHSVPKRSTESQSV